MSLAAKRFVVTMMAVAAFAALFSAGARADGYLLAPYTKLRLTVLQWNPSKGEYLRWEAVGGEFTVSQSGTISVPLIGSMPVANMDSTQLEASIANRLRKVLDLVGALNATVEVLEYPPIYVVGIVATPGEYRFRPGLTVLQALALAGGRYRVRQGERSPDQLSLVSELQGIRSDIVRSVARIARLQAELSSKEIQFPPELTNTSNKNVVVEDIMASERAILSTRENAQKRQIGLLADLRDLLSEEIRVLEERAKAEDAAIALAESELARVGTLVEKGLATISRKSDLELIVAGMRANRLDRATAIMRARQNLTDASRNSNSIRDQHVATVATELQEAKASLERLNIRKELLQRLVAIEGIDMPGDEPDLAFTIVRQKDGLSSEVAASESTLVLPGDVVKVGLSIKLGQ